MVAIVNDSNLDICGDCCSASKELMLLMDVLGWRKRLCCCCCCRKDEPLVVRGIAEDDPRSELSLDRLDRVGIDEVGPGYDSADRELLGSDITLNVEDDDGCGTGPRSSSDVSTRCKDAGTVRSSTAVLGLEGMLGETISIFEFRI